MFSGVLSSTPQKLTMLWIHTQGPGTANAHIIHITFLRLPLRAYMSGTGNQAGGLADGQIDRLYT
jgi:hypothetical protein